MSTTKKLIEEYKKKRAKILQMASPEAIEKRHKGGQWTASDGFAGRRYSGAIPGGNSAFAGRSSILRAARPDT